MLLVRGHESLQVKLDHLYTVTGRLGYTYDNWLAYVKGGYATADIDVTSNIGGDVTFAYFYAGPLRSARQAIATSGTTAGSSAAASKR